MPELPEVECIVRGLRSPLVGKSFQQLEFFRPDLRETIPIETMRKLLLGRTLASISRRAKYLVFSIEEGHGMLIHLGMTGNLLLKEQADPMHKHTHAVFSLGSGGDEFYLHYVDARRFGRISCFANTCDEHPFLRHLGQEPLTCNDLGMRLWQAGRSRRCSIKNLLLDSRVVVGIGNIYACEILRETGIPPQKSSASLARESYEKIARACRKILARAISMGGTTFRDYRNHAGDTGYFAVDLTVYGRKNCRVCAGKVCYLRMGGRGTYYCAACQS